MVFQKRDGTSTVHGMLCQKIILIANPGLYGGVGVAGTLVGNNGQHII
jgi:hypothetical protein